MGSIRFLYPGWYVVVMGLGGLSLAWLRASATLGPVAHGTGTVLAWASGCVLLALAAATVWRGLKHADAWAEDRRHPVRRAFIATLPVALLIFSTATIALHGPGLVPELLWWMGSLGQIAATAWTLQTWWQANPPERSLWTSLTPALFVPVAGNVLAPLGGVPLGHAEWAIAQMGIGILFWPPLMALLMARIAVVGPWPERMRPASFIFIAPPAVVGLSLVQIQAPTLLVWMMGGMAMFTTLWVLPQLSRILRMPFGLPHWGMSFPLTAVTSLCLALGERSPSLVGIAAQCAGVGLLALSSTIIAWLAWQTVAGLVAGRLLVPEVPPPSPSGSLPAP